MLEVSRRSVRHSWVLYAGCFVAVAAGVALLGLAACVIAAGNAYLDHHPGGVAVTVTGDDMAPRTERHFPEEQSPAGLQAVLGFASGLSGFMTVFVVAGTFAFVVAARRRELGLLRLIGATPRQIRRMILGEALVVAAAAAVTGSLLAYAATPAVLDLAAGTRFSPVRLEPPSPWVPLSIAAAIGVVAALLGAWVSARRAAKAVPVDALRESATEPPALTAGRVVAGLLGFGTAGAMSVFIRPGDLAVAMTMAVFVPIVFVVGAVALAPVLVPVVGRAWGLVFRGACGVPGYLADRNVRATPRHTGSLAAPIIAIAAIGGGLSLMVSFIGDLTHAQGVRAANPSLVVSSPDDRDLTAELRALDGAAAVDATLPAEVVLTDRGAAVGAEAEGIDPATFQQVRRLDVQEGSLDRLADGFVAMTAMTARDNGYRLGEPVRLSFLDGTAETLTLAAVVADAPDLVPEVMLPEAMVERHVPSAVPERWIVLPAPETGLGALGDGVRAAAGPVQVESMDSWLRSQSEEFRRINGQALLIILVPVGVYAGIAIVNLLLIGNLRRRREFVVARLLGATPRRLRQMILCESSLVALAALSIGGGITAAVSLPTRRAMMAGVDPVATTVPWPSLLGIALGCLGLAAAAALASAFRVLRDAQPSEASGE